MRVWPTDDSIRLSGQPEYFNSEVEKNYGPTLFGKRCSAHKRETNTEGAYRRSHAVSACGIARGGTISGGRLARRPVAMAVLCHRREWQCRPLLRIDDIRDRPTHAAARYWKPSAADESRKGRRFGSDAERQVCRRSVDKPDRTHLLRVFGDEQRAAIPVPQPRCHVLHLRGRRCRSAVFTNLNPKANPRCVRPRVDTVEIGRLQAVPMLL